MSTVDPERSATRFGATLAVVVAVLAGAGLGVATGTDVGVLLALVGAGGVALSVQALQSGANHRRAAGSIGLIAGTTVLGAGVTLSTSLVPLFVGVGVTAAALNATTATTGNVSVASHFALRRSIAVLAVGAVLSTLLHANLFVRVPRVVGRAFGAIAWSHSLSALVVLQVEILLAVELLYWAVPILDDWLPEGRDLRAAVTEPLDFDLSDVPIAYWVFLGAQTALALTNWGPRFFATVLDSLSAFGTAVRFLLLSGALHGAVAALFALEVAVLAARGGQRALVWWAGEDPPRAVAFGAGGVVVLAVAGAVEVVDAYVSILPEAVTTSQSVTAFGLTATVAAGLAFVFVAVFLVSVVGLVYVRPWVAVDAASGFALGAAALFAAALAAATEGAAPVPVFAAVAAALVVRDLGDHAAEVGLQVGRNAETRRGEIAHAIGTLGVAAAAVGLAVVALYVIGPVSLPAASWRGHLALSLVLVALLSFAVVLGRE